jgi:chromosome segregation ATPase
VQEYFAGLESEIAALKGRLE